MKKLAIAIVTYLFSANAFGFASCTGTIENIIFSNANGASMWQDKRVYLYVHLEFEGRDVNRSPEPEDFHNLRICGIHSSNTETRQDHEMCQYFAKILMAAQVTAQRVKFNWDIPSSVSNCSQIKGGLYPLKELRLLKN